MPITSLTLVKAHLRVTGTDDDSLITAYCDAAEAAAEHYCNRSFGSPLPSAVQAAVFLMVGDMYENREEQSERPLSINKTCENLLNTAKDWSRVASGPLPAGALLDNNPINIGDDWGRVWRWKNQDGTAIDVTGYAGTFTLYDGSTEVHSGSLTISDATGGVFAYEMSETVTDELSSKEYWYRVRVVSPGGDTTTLDRKRVIAQ